MTIEQYLNKIEALQSDKSTVVFTDNADLEFYIQKIRQKSNEPSFTPDIFLKKQISETTTLNHEIIKLFENQLGLLFWKKNLVMFVLQTVTRLDQNIDRILDS